MIVGYMYLEFRVEPELEIFTIPNFPQNGLIIQSFLLPPLYLELSPFEKKFQWNLITVSSVSPLGPSFSPRPLPTRHYPLHLVCSRFSAKIG